MFLQIFFKDFTGGICESISLSNIKQNKTEASDIRKQKYDELYYMMKKSIERKSLMACAIAVCLKFLLNNQRSLFFWLFKGKK